ncbi:MAG: adenylosuccinate lyase [Verrucomicrobia bacterium]|nr:adenylosuccinate lyase [Verrucomicrobiota bacterium]MDA1088547.1 adenylosuccinate lyase [Verrucomicrobiota bacterium]
MSAIPNVLAERYASDAIREIWSPAGKVVLEREFWIAVLKAQRELGLDIPAEAIVAYEKVRDDVDLDAIREREAVTKHDVKARIEEFCAKAGFEHIHKGMTSRDLTENVEQLQVMRSLRVVIHKAVALLDAFARRATEFETLVITARTHNVAAQPTTFGKRLAMFGQEAVIACERLDNLLQRYPVRGLKGAVGTQQDQLTLFDGDPSRVADLECKILEHLGFAEALESVGQIYPRSLDFDVVSAMYQLGSAPASFAQTLRLMAGHELASEGFAKGQVGSSAMPHKMNSRSCERINGLHTILNGYVTMAAGLAGNQWNEGDVSCSVVRRVVLPDTFFAIDGLLETALVVLEQLEVFPAMIERENTMTLPFLATTTILMQAVQAGAGREEAHEAIKEHAVATVRDLRGGKRDDNDLVERLAKDGRIPLDGARIQSIVDDAESFIGAAREQTARFRETVETWKALYPEGGNYSAGAIL